MNAYAATAYHQSTRAGLRPAELVAMLLMRAADHMQAAISAQDARDFEARFKQSDSARTVILALRQNLSFDTPQVAEMSKLYDDYYALLTSMIDKFNIASDVDSGRAVQDGLAQLAQAWRQIAQSSEGSGPGAPGVSPTAASLSA